MDFHGTSMAFQGVAWSIHGVSMGVSWSSMECHGVPMEFYGVSMEFHGMPCSFTKFHVMPWNSMEFLGVSMKFNIHSWQFVMRIHRNSLIKQLINLLATCLSLHFLLERKNEKILKLLKSRNRASVSLNYTDNAQVS